MVISAGFHLNLTAVVGRQRPRNVHKKPVHHPIKEGRGDRPLAWVVGNLIVGLLAPVVGDALQTVQVEGLPARGGEAVSEAIRPVGHDENGIFELLGFRVRKREAEPHLSFVVR